MKAPGTALQRSSRPRRQTSAGRVLMHWQLSGLRSSCAKPPAKNVKANQIFFMVLFLERVWSGSAEGEGIHLRAGIKELDLEQVVARRCRQPHKLVQAVRIDHAATVGRDIRAP